MAFCPNCGTPNTDQAEKCVSCSFELSAIKAKPKFKGTMIMQGVQLPASPPAAAAAPPQSTAPAPSATPAAQPAAPPGKNAFAKTMMGGVGLGQGFHPAGAPGAPAGTPGAGAFAPPPASQPTDLARAATIEGPRPPFEPQPGGFAPIAPAAPSTTDASAVPPQTGSATPAPSAGFSGPPASGGFSNAGSFGSATAPAGSSFSGGGASSGGFGNTGGFGDSLPPGAPKSNTKVVAIGCAVALVLSCVVAGLLYSILKEKFQNLLGSSSGADDGSALEWRGSLGSALVQVAALCQSDCDSAAVYFHPDVQATLLGEAKALTALRANKLVDPTQSEAQMLNNTDDEDIAEKLNLDAAQCVRVTAGSAKVVGCSVPTPGGQPNLRIVHMSEIGTL